MIVFNVVPELFLISKVTAELKLLESTVSTWSPFDPVNPTTPWLESSTHCTELPSL